MFSDTCFSACSFSGFSSLTASAGDSGASFFSSAFPVRSFISLITSSGFPDGLALWTTKSAHLLAACFMSSLS